MARTTGRAARRSSRLAGRRHPTWILPLALGVLVVLALGGWLLLRGARPAAGSPQPIATLKTQDFHALVWSPTDPNTVFFGHHQGLLKSTDGGHTWQPTTLRDADAMNLAASPKAPRRVYAAGHGVFLRSDDGGTTWTAPDSPIQGADIHGFAQSPADPNRLYAVVVGQGLLASPDGGTTWQAANPSPPGVALAVSPDGRTLYMGTANAVEQSTDGGSTWTPSGTGLPADAQVIALSVAPSGDPVFAATTRGLFRRSGGTWTLTNLKQTILTVAVDALQPNVVLTVDERGQVYRSEDGGMTWGGGSR